jgi:hypothetical protein
MKFQIPSTKFKIYWDLKFGICLVRQLADGACDF